MKLRTILSGCCIALVFGANAEDEIVCPEGAKPNGETTPEVREAWCEITHNGAVVLHGPYRSWWPNGVLGTSGQGSLKFFGFMFAAVVVYLCVSYVLISLQFSVGGAL